MSVILGSLIGLGSAVATGVLDTVKAGQDRKSKIAEAQSQKELIQAQSDADARKTQVQVEADVAKMKAELDSKLKELNAQAEIDETKQLYEHDMSFQNISGFMQTIRASVRPIVTYVFFSMFVAFKCILVVYAIRNNADLATIANTILDAETQTLFSAVIAFWFGSRTIDRVKASKPIR